MVKRRVAQVIDGEAHPLQVRSCEDVNKIREA